MPSFRGSTAASETGKRTRLQFVHSGGLARDIGQLRLDYHLTSVPVVIFVGRSLGERESSHERQPRTRSSEGKRAATGGEQRVSNQSGLYRDRYTLSRGLRREHLCHRYRLLIPVRLRSRFTAVVTFAHPRRM